MASVFILLANGVYQCLVLEGSGAAENLSRLNPQGGSMEHWAYQSPACKYAHKKGSIQQRLLSYWLCPRKLVDLTVSLEP